MCEVYLCGNVAFGLTSPGMALGGDVRILRWGGRPEVPEGSPYWPGMPMSGGGSTCDGDDLAGGRGPDRPIAIRP